jgi:hypothetical protein
MPGLDPGIFFYSGQKDRRVKPGDDESGGMVSVESLVSAVTLDRRIFNPAHSLSP